MSQLYQNALYGTVMILVVAVLRRALKDRLLPGARLCLWAACLFRLLTPAAPESVLSFWGLSRLFAREETPVPIFVPADYAPITGAPAPQAPGPVISWETAALAVWAIVSVALAVRYALSWRRTRRAVSCAIPLGRDDPRYAPLPKCARLREGPMEGAPLTFGAVRPTVVLSPGLDGEALDCVLAHEGVHAARRDNLWHYAMALALAVYWWNPAVWLMSRLLRRDVELSCDRAALKKLGTERRADYAQALVTLAAQGSGPAFCQTFGRKAAEERILSIMKFKKTSIIGVIFTLTLVLAVTAAFASEPKADACNGPLEGKTLDGVVSVPDIEATRGIQSDLPEVDPDDVDLSMMKELLAKKVADGEITQEEADQRLAATEEMLEQARRGEVKMVMAEDGMFYGLGVSRMYYKDEDGNLVPFNPDIVASGYVLDEGLDISDYNVELPTFDEDGNPVGSGIVGSRFYSYEVVTDADAASGGLVGSVGADADAPVPSAAPAGAPTWLNAPVAPSTSCGVAGCTETRYHAHNEGRTILLSDPCPVEGCTIIGNHIHGDVCYSCNGAGHDGGVCDGSCYTYASPTDTHHSESHHSGEHH